MTRPLVSVLMAYYNHAGYVQKAIDSVLEQTYKEIELIIVNDGSPDTEEFNSVVARYIGGERVKVIHQPNQGIAAARNTALAAAKGEFLNFLDSDDWLHPDKLSRQVAVLEAENEPGLVYSDVAYVKNDQEQFKPEYSIANRAIGPLEPDIFDTLWVHGYFEPNTALWRRKWYEQAGPLMLGIDGHDDYEFWLRLSAMGCKVRYLPERLAYYRLHDRNTSKNQDYMDRTRIIARQEIARRFPRRVAESTDATVTRYILSEMELERVQGEVKILVEHMESVEQDRQGRMLQVKEQEKRARNAERELSTLQKYTAALNQQKQDLLNQLGRFEQDLRALQQTRTVRTTRSLGLVAKQIKQTVSLTTHVVGAPVIHKLKGPLEGALDLPEASQALPGHIEVKGWAISNAGPIQKVEVWLNNDLLGEANYGQPRPDVLVTRPWHWLAECGYTAEFEFYSRRLGLGSQTLRVIVFDDQGNRQEWTRPVQLVEAPASPAAAAFSAMMDQYPAWIKENEPDQAELKKQRTHSLELAYQPLISILTPVYNTPGPVLRATIESVLDQTYENWELCLVDGHSTEPEVAGVLSAFARLDSRIKVKSLEQNLGISGNSNEAMCLANGEFIALLDHDDTLAPFALYEMVNYLNLQPQTDMVYSDEDRLGTNGQRHTPFFKPAWSPDLLQSFMYTGHLTLYRRSLVQELGGFRPEFDLSQDYDLALRVTEKASHIGHVAKVLYHWRAIAGSGAAGDKPHARASNLAALADAVKRQGYEAEVLEFITANRVKFTTSGQALVSIIIPSDNEQNITRCLAALMISTAYPSYEILLVTNSKLAAQLGQRYTDNPQVRLVTFDEPFNFSAKCNRGVEQALGEFVLFLNDDVLAFEPDWLECLVGYFQQPEVGAVAPKLIYSNGTIQHAGLVTGVRGFVGTAFHTLPADTYAYFNLAQSTRTTSALSAACLLMPKQLFEEIGGYDEVNTPIMHSDLDLCFKIRQAGKRLVYTPFATLEHVGHVSLGEVERQGQTHSQKSDLYLLKHWGEYTAHDPYFTDNMRDFLYHDSPTRYRMQAGRYTENKAPKADILIASHDLSLTGAPIILNTLAAQIKPAYFLTLISPVSGKLLEAYQRLDMPVIIDPLIQESPASLEKLINEYDVVVANTILFWKLVSLAKSLGKPVIWLIHESDYGVQMAQENSEIRQALADADQVIFPSKETASKYHAFAANGNHRVIYYGLKAPEEVSDRRELQVQAGRINITSVGSVEPRKGQDILVKTIRQLSPALREAFEFNFVGRVLDQPYYREQVKATEKFSNVHWVGEVSHQQALEYIASCDIFICTSRDDPSPVVVLEAFQRGKTVVSTSVGVMSEVIHDGENGFLIKDTAAAELGSILEKLSRDEVLRNKAGAGAIKTYQELFTLERYGRQIEDVIDQFLILEPGSSGRQS